ncbi:hypothetical protein KM043_011331 [Ampulex compressa]|nr:hypothetical protein KM043_011331 [Ampulex compressa]
MEQNFVRRIKLKFKMSHHFVTVCVVCVLCAAHTPCSAHNDFATSERTSQNFANSENGLGQMDKLQPSWMLSRFKDARNLAIDKFPKMLKVNNSHQIDAVEVSINKSSSEVQATEKMKDAMDDQDIHQLIINPDSMLIKDIEILNRLGQTDLTYESVDSRGSDKAWNHIDRRRIKRDLGINDMYFMKKIFKAYGDGTSITMEGFEKLLRKLGLLRLLSDISNLEDHSATSHQKESQLDSIINLQNNGLPDYDGILIKERCLSSKELLTTVSRNIPYNAVTNNGTTLPSWLFERVCPVLVYQLAGESSSERNGCIRVPENYKPVVNDNYTSEDVTHNMVQVWVYSTISILIISLCGLLGVAVIPVMGKVYYHQLLQFLVALAIGTLCGDALIHLLPHAMMSPILHEHDQVRDHDEHSKHTEMELEDQHNINMWKGLVAMMGLVLFFFTEKALTMLAEWRKHRQRRNKLPSRVRVMRETEGPNSNAVGEKLCKHKYSSYPYCYGEITTDSHDNHHNHQHNNHERPPIIEEEKPLTSNCNSVSKIMTNDLDKKQNEDWRLDETIMNNSKKNTDGADVPLNESESYTVIIREHETKHHGHTHSHGHVHSAPESMSSVAWMVVMGDGLHNFTDGMAIGAAFSANIAGGFSTAIAVFCHELPHELGDFAVLLKAGMSAKQAVFYNLLSSVLCLFGMIFGVLLGSTPAATTWMFAAAAGMFIYIALVDMIPELSSSHSAEGSSHWHFILQALGLVTGLGIMLIIALYEHDLKNIFSD